LRGWVNKSEIRIKANNHLNNVCRLRIVEIFITNKRSENEKGAIDNPVVYANGEEIFVRLSAFDDDKRIDKINKYLRPGSYTTTTEDY
jgi:hypothetical protein